jgi:hypothetical protein
MGGERPARARGEKVEPVFCEKRAKSGKSGTFRDSTETPKARRRNQGGLDEVLSQFRHISLQAVKGYVRESCRMQPPWRGLSPGKYGGRETQVRLVFRTGVRP